MAELTEHDLKVVLTTMANRFDAELLATPEEELVKRWWFQWQENTSVEWNLYKFSEALEAFRRDCRKWEEHHHGSCCVVERVRDKYLMPRIREFMAEFVAHSHTLTCPECGGYVGGVTGPRLNCLCG